jgi:hypothetical protein
MYSCDPCDDRSCGKKKKEKKMRKEKKKKHGIYKAI